MRAFLVDDEPLALRRLARLLEATGSVEVVGTESDPAAAAARLTPGAADVLFLDIEMPGLNGFQLLARLEEPPLVVFTTAFDQYALRAFQANSIDYLLKPVDPAQLDRALAKLERMLGGTESRGNLRGLLSQVAEALESRRPEYLTRIASRVGDKIEFVETLAVTHFYAKDKLTFAATAAKHYVIDQTIADLEQRLDPRRFLRIHRATLVNTEHIRELYTWFGGKMLVRLKDGTTELPVAKERVSELREKLGI